MTFLAATQAGASAIPVDTTSKKPLIRWGKYQEAIADHDELLEWQRWLESGRCGIGLVCGAVSGRLVAIDIEGSFRERLPQLAERLRAAGLFECFESWIQGYTETTPRGGLHILVHVGGDGRVDGNTKLAMAADGHVLIETRGEGGYVVIAPSRNGSRGWDLVSGNLDSIAWATADEWAAVAAVLASFDESSRPEPAPQAPQTSSPPILRLSDSWIDDELARLPAVTEILAAHGWTPARSADSYGAHWVRPDKDPREGHSASVSHDAGRLWVHSTSAGLPVGVSMDALDVLFALEHRRIPTLSERTEYLRARRQPQPVLADGAAGRGAESSPAPLSLRLDDSFWQSREWLIATRAAAWARGLSPTGVLGALISTYATTIPMGIWIPPVWGERAPLNMYCCLVGQSGSGKTASMRVAFDLVGARPNPDILLGRSLRSGEGLINLVTRSSSKRKDALDVGEPSFRNAVQITFDEGAALGRQAERAGATVIPYLNTAWAGQGAVGGAKAGEAGYFPADLVRVCAVIGVQFGAAANLFTGESAALGFPQRLVFFGLRDPSMMDHDVDAMSMEPIRPLGLPELQVTDYVRYPVYLDVPREVATEIRLWTQNKEHGSGLTDPLDGHRMQLQLRLAGILAVMSGEMSISLSDWSLSSQLAACSRQIRTQLLTALGDVSLEKARSLGRQDVVREEVRDDARLNKYARRITAFAQAHPEGVTLKEIKSRLDAGERRRRDEIVAYAEAKGWVIHKDGRYFHRGER